MQADLRVFERRLQAKGYVQIAGVDEAGRGPLAGPVVSAAVMLPRGFRSTGIKDSKQLTESQREFAYERLYEQAVTIGIGIVDPAEIDRINILQAARLSMVMAVCNLNPAPQFLLIDGPVGIDCTFPQQTVIRGDALSVSVAAASIVAKVTRDRLMNGYHLEFPHFGFDRHKGYATQDHRNAIAAYGPCRIHRRSFKGVCEYLFPPGQSAPSGQDDMG